MAFNFPRCRSPALYSFSQRASEVRHNVRKHPNPARVELFSTTTQLWALSRLQNGRHRHLREVGAFKRPGRTLSDIVSGYSPCCCRRNPRPPAGVDRGACACSWGLSVSQSLRHPYSNNGCASAASGTSSTCSKCGVCFAVPEDLKRTTKERRCGARAGGHPMRKRRTFAATARTLAGSKPTAREGLINQGWQFPVVEHVNPPLDMDRHQQQ